MKSALPGNRSVVLSFLAAVMLGTSLCVAVSKAQTRQSDGELQVAIYESPLQKWKAQCRRSGGKYEKYCAGGVKHCCCYSASYCEGMPEPVDALQLPTGPGQGGASVPGAPVGQPNKQVR